MNLLTRPEAAQRLRISIRGLDEKRKRREIPFHKIGAKVLIAEKDIEKYLESRKIA